MTRIAFDIPQLDTARLILREPRQADLDALTAFNASERSRFVGGPRNRHDCWRSLLGMIGHWAMRGFGFWMIQDRASGLPAGGVGFIHHEGWDEPELGWHVYDGFEGKGIAYEAALRARAYGARHFDLPAPISYIDPANTRSARLATRLGARFERDGAVMGHPCHVYRHPVQGAV